MIPFAMMHGGSAVIGHKCGFAALVKQREPYMY